MVRKITSSVSEINNTLSKFDTSLTILLDKYSYPLPPKKHDSHVNCEFVNQWINGYNSHIELYNDHMTNFDDSIE